MTSNKTEPEEDLLRDYWDSILGPHPESIEVRLTQEFGLPHPGTLTIATSTGKKIVSIDPDGTISYGEGYDANSAAEEFWTSMALKRQGMAKRLHDLAIMEALLVRLGRADLNHGDAAVRASSESATDSDKVTLERASLGLRSIIGQVMGYARDLAARWKDPEPEQQTIVEVPRNG
jgi:hypothetical protein